MPGQRTQQIIKTTLLVALGVFFYSRIANGTLYYYINERFAVFTLIGIGGLVLLGLSYRWDSAAAEEAHEQEHSHVHVHDHSHTLSWGGIAIIALPIVLGLATPPQPLGAAALANRDVTLSMNESALPVGLRNREKSPLDKTIMDWWQEFRIATATSQGTWQQEFIDQAVRVSGFVYKDEQYGNDHFLVTRFVVSCCVADANVLGLLVNTPDAATFVDDQWVEVEGKFIANQPVDGWSMPIISAHSINPIDVPNQPYLYP